MSPDPFFHLDTVDHCELLDCSTACPNAGTAGFCGARIHPDCLRIDPNSTVRVGLSVPARDWFEMLSNLGETLMLNRNSLAILGQVGTAPALTDWRNAVLPRDVNGLFTPNLAEHASLWAIREMSPTGLIHSFEMRDTGGEAFHKVILTRSSNRTLFEQFVTEHQSPPSEAGAWFSPNHAWNAHRWRGIATRIPSLRYRLAIRADDVRPLNNEQLLGIFQAAAEASFLIRTTTYSRGLIVGAAWVPSNHDCERKDGVHFIHGEQVGLHVNLPFVETAWLWMGRCLCCDENRWTIEVGNKRDEVSLAITGGNPSSEEDWRDLLTGCLQ